MAYCPKCSTEYAEGRAECIDCHVPLRPGPPPTFADDALEPADVKLVRVRTFSGPTAQLEADLARNLLKEEGIPCVLPGEMSAEVLPGVDIVQLLVHEDDAERANEILTSYLDLQQSP